MAIEDRSKTRSCPQCQGSGRRWYIGPKEWPYGESEPPSRPVPVKCGYCAGAGFLRAASPRAPWHYDSEGYCDNPARGY